MQSYYEPPKIVTQVCNVNRSNSLVWPPESECKTSLENNNPLYVTIPTCFSEVVDKYLKDKLTIKTSFFGTANSGASLSDVDGNQFTMGTSRLG